MIYSHPRRATAKRVRETLSWHRLLCSGLVGWCMAISAANAENMLANPEFDTDLELQGWEPFLDRTEWSTRDISDSNSSGSARGEHLTTGNNGSLAVLTQCIETQFEGTFAFGAWTFSESGQGGGSFGGRTIVRAFTESSDCSGTAVTQHSPSVFIRDQWVLTEGVFEAPEGTQSIEMRFSIFKASGVEHDAVVHFDNAFLHRVDGIHSDRFESP